jgi:hypothetical protein
MQRVSGDAASQYAGRDAEKDKGKRRYRTIKRLQGSDRDGTMMRSLRRGAVELQRGHREFQILVLSHIYIYVPKLTCICTSTGVIQLDSDGSSV